MARYETIHEKHIFYILSAIFCLITIPYLSFPNIIVQGGLVTLYFVMALYLIVKAITTFTDKEEM